MSTGQYSVGILGMGRVASGYDDPSTTAVRTHLKACLAEPRFRLAMIADHNDERAETERRRFRLDAKIVSPDAILRAPLDVLCIASPSGTHIGLAQRVEGARLLLIEKPLEGDVVRRAETLVGLRARGATVAVAHIRRFIHPLANWLDSARSGGYGRLASAVIWYGRGMRNNAVHGLDLVAAAIGTQLASVDEIAAPIDDFSPQDLTRSLLLRMRDDNVDVPVVLFGVDGRLQTTFTVDLRFAAARILVEDCAGVRATLYRAAPVTYGGFPDELVPVEQWNEGELPVMTAMWRNLADHLDGLAPLRASGSEALAVYDLLDQIDERLLAGARGQ